MRLQPTHYDRPGCGAPVHKLSVYSRSIAEVFAQPVTARMDGGQLVVSLRGWRAIPCMDGGVRRAWYWGHQAVRRHQNGRP